MTCKVQIAEQNTNEHVLAIASQGNLRSYNWAKLSLELLTSYTHLFNTKARFLTYTHIFQSGPAQLTAFLLTHLSPLSLIRGLGKCG